MSAPLEIERKFLVKSDGWRAAAKSVPIAQAYLAREGKVAVRVRQKGAKFLLTIKREKSDTTRVEWEIEIPESDARILFDEVADGPGIRKVRHLVAAGPHTFEVDEFEGDNDGLIVAEVELSSADEAFEKPDWLGPEVTDDPRFLNARLIDHPFCEWGTDYPSLLADKSSG